jgi:hypothetical protein
MLRYQESIRIAAPADLIYDLVADVTRTGDRSPECRRVEWLGESAKAVTGARFRGHNRWRGFTWWRNATIYGSRSWTRVRLQNRTRTRHLPRHHHLALPV